MRWAAARIKTRQLAGVLLGQRHEAVYIDNGDAIYPVEHARGRYHRRAIRRAYGAAGVEFGPMAAAGKAPRIPRLPSATAHRRLSAGADQSAKAAEAGGGVQSVQGHNQKPSRWSWVLTSSAIARDPAAGRRRERRRGPVDTVRRLPHRHRHGRYRTAAGTRASAPGFYPERLAVLSRQQLQHTVTDKEQVDRLLKKAAVASATSTEARARLLP